jgi:anti-sigma B factor antagonist
VELEIRKEAEATVIVLRGALSIGEGEAQLRDRFRERIEAGDRRFVFDMTGVTYIDSGGLGETTACAVRARERDGEVRIVVAPGGKVEQILRITQLDRAFNLFHDVRKAVASYS